MPDMTPVWGLPYPCASDTIDPTIFCEFSEAVDAALVTLNDEAEFLVNRPGARITRTANANTFAAGVASNVTFDTNVFDNQGAVDLGTDNAAITIPFDGVYWVSFSVGGMLTFTTWTAYFMNVTQNGTRRVARKYNVVTAQSVPTDNTVFGVITCSAGDIIRGQYTFIGTGGPQTMSRASLSVAFICDL